jgi:hypothetical protein
VAYQFRQSKHLLMLVDTLLFLAIAVAFLTMAQYTMTDTVWRESAPQQSLATNSLWALC